MYYFSHFQEQKWLYLFNNTEMFRDNISKVGVQGQNLRDIISGAGVQGYGLRDINRGAGVQG